MTWMMYAILGHSVNTGIDADADADADADGMQDLYGVSTIDAY